MSSKLKGRNDPIKSERNKVASKGGADAFRGTRRSGSAFHGKRVVQASEPAKPVGTKDDAAESSSDAERREDIRLKTSLSLSGHALPPLTSLVDTLSQFRRLQRLDLSSLSPSEANPKGLDRLDWLAKAVFRSEGMSKQGAQPGADSAFGESLTWLNVSNNAELKSEGCVGLEALGQLHVLTLSSCNLHTFPLSINPLKNLRALVLNNNNLAKLPSNFPHLPQLNSLILSHNKLKTLPTSLPASVPALKKLSIGHNRLEGSHSLPDFSVCLSLRDVRINDNQGIGALPDHINLWGKGADGTKAPGLELLELKDCGLDSWESIDSLVPSGKNPQPHGRKGLTQLLLKGNGVAKLSDYKARILEAHPMLRVLDNERLRPREKPLTSAAADEKSQLNTEDAEIAEIATLHDALYDEDRSDSDDEEAAKMAAEMRAMRRGQLYEAPETTRAANKPRNGEVASSDDKQENSTLKAKHKRGTRSGKKAKSQTLTKNEHLDKEARVKPKSQPLMSSAGASSIEPFFESVDQESERNRLSLMHEEKSRQSQISLGRKKLAGGVLEDVNEAAIGKARRLEARSVQELEMTDGAEDHHSNPASQKRKKFKSRNEEQEKSIEQRNSSIAAIVDVRGTKRSVEQDAKGFKKVKVGGPQAKLPFVSPVVANHLGVGTDAWGASSAWS